MADQEYYYNPPANNVKPRGVLTNTTYNQDHSKIEHELVDNSLKALLLNAHMASKKEFDAWKEYTNAWIKAEKLHEDFKESNPHFQNVQKAGEKLDQEMEKLVNYFENNFQNPNNPVSRKKTWQSSQDGQALREVYMGIASGRSTRRYITKNNLMDRCFKERPYFDIFYKQDKPI